MDVWNYRKSTHIDVMELYRVATAAREGGEPRGKGGVEEGVGDGGGGSGGGGGGRGR